MALDTTSFASALKVHYTSDRIENMVYSDNPFLALVPKMEKFGGKNLPIPIIYGNPQGRSAAFATAQANKTSSKIKDFVLTRASDYSLASITNEVIEASQGDANAFMEAATTEIDGAIQAATRSLAIAMYGSGSGSIGQCNASVTGTSLQLKNINDVTNFEVGMKIVFSTADGGGSIKAGSVTVNNVDRGSGLLTVDALSGIASGSGVAANDYIFVQGDYDSKIKGLAAWVPSSTPSSTAFFGVDRSVDTRLGGLRYDGTSQPIEEALVDAAALAAREGAKLTHAFINFVDFASLEKALASKVQYIDLKVNPQIGFRGIVIQGPRGPINVIPDQNCPSGVCYMLKLDSWKLYSLGKAPKLLEGDGMRMLRESAADAVEVRVGYYAQLGCNAPGYNIRVALG